MMPLVLFKPIGVITLIIIIDIFAVTKIAPQMFSFYAFLRILQMVNIHEFLRILKP